MQYYTDFVSTTFQRESRLVCRYTSVMAPGLGFDQSPLRPGMRLDTCVC